MAQERIQCKTVAEWLTELSTLNKKTLQVEEFKEYLVKKNALHAALIGHYEQTVYRTMRWRAFINTRRSEDRMVNRFKKKMGGPKDVILGWGDWSNETMRFHEPTKGRGMRSLFKRAGYQLFLVNEYNTSCRCYGCSGGACVKFKEVENPRFWKRKERPKVLCHGLLRCTTCKRLWNRDRNGR